MNAWLARLTHLPREARDTLFLLAVIGWVVMPHMTELPLWTSALTLGVLLWRGWLALRARPLPSPWWRRALLLAALAGTWASHGTLLGQDAGTTLVVALLTLKTLELRARRDALVVFFLGFFVLLTNFFHSQSLPLALAMLLGLWGLLTALVNAHRPVGHPGLGESARMAARMMLGGAPLMVALFMFFPRFAPLWGLPADALSQSGLSSRMEIGNIAQLAQDRSIAMRVRFDGPVPAQDALYFRGPVFNHFDGRLWSAVRGGGSMDVDTAPAPADLQVSGAAVDYEVTLEPHRLPWLLLLDAAPQPPRISGERRSRMTADLQWATYPPVHDLLRYRARSYTQFRYGLGQQGHADASAPLNRYLRLPAGFDPRTHALAAQLRAQTGGDSAALVHAALLRLQTGGYTYTLEPGAYGQHTADEFWFDRKQGFCEHIASSFVVLMRAAGVPARVVGGFQGGERNPVDGYWIVRNSDAHAWAEVWMPDSGWQRVDPTASVSPARVSQLQRLRPQPGMVATALDGLSPDLLNRLRNVWDAIDNRWNQWVLNYTQTRQFELLQHLGFDSPDWQDMLRVLGALLALGALGALAWSHYSRQRQDPWLRLLAQARQRMARSGLPVPADATPRQLWQLARQQGGLPPDLRQRLGDWLLAMERLRYAPPPAPPSSAPSSPQQGAQSPAPAAITVADLARQWRALQSAPWPTPAPQRPARTAA